MLDPPVVNLKVIVIGNPSLTVQENSLIISNQWFPSIYKFLNNIINLCNEQPHRIYWRLTELDYLPIYDYLSLKSALNQMHQQEIYIVQDERPYVNSQISEAKHVGNLSKDSHRLEFNSYNADSLLWADDEFSSMYLLSDLEILRCAAPCYLPDTKVHFSYLFTKSPPLFTREREDILRQLRILMKGFPKERVNPVAEALPQWRKHQPAPPSKGKRKKK
ncbi:uncharacterized protein LOC112493928 [Cephus cinctus]|uniref:Uncharacterized protein LOC112493928 n=1 Tax=Cephus cinctus TaxID=211228 RepID=A0AAJ7RBL1_CEPCN|nr:uncharacterized protein LOC112493928 [Cephus cinctus]